MSSNEEPNPQREDNPPCSPAANSPANSERAAWLEGECERLQKEVKRLEEERERDRKTIEFFEFESQGFRRALYDWAVQQISPEDLERWAAQLTEEGQELHQFIGELENIVRENESA